ncbi:hypothetical protein ACIQCJ_02115 [Streptomyces sp. NPDC093221]|uniref:hypothetical protein n=1 Tax=Streptomyces sp. NPDC093221 TaxID=3366032 RepID=UPI00380B8026
MSTETEPVFILITMDRKADFIVFTRSDGKEARFPLSSSPFEASSVLSKIHLAPFLGALLVETQYGDEVLFELPIGDALDQLAGRLVVYLDQNQWSALSNARHRAHEVSKELREAADRLDTWLREGRLVLPASSAHYYETTKRFDARKRYELGLTILQCSRGWQMRDPPQVRRNEIQAGLRLRLSKPDSVQAEAVFTLDPNALHSSIRGKQGYSASKDLPPEQVRAVETLTSAVAYIDTMLDAERLETGPDTGWAAANQRFSDWLDGEGRDSQQKRKVIDILMLSDLRRELAEESYSAGLPLEQLPQWFMKDVIRDINGYPMLGIFRETLHQRHLNKGTTWRPNDLTDMIYLSCAAGYADIVVCEKHMREPLTRGVRRVGRSARVFRHLTEAVDAIDTFLASAPAARFR